MDADDGKAVAVAPFEPHLPADRGSSGETAHPRNYPGIVTWRLALGRTAVGGPSVPDHMFNTHTVHNLSASQPPRRVYPLQPLNDLTQLSRGPLTNKVQMKHHDRGPNVLELSDSSLTPMLLVTAPSVLTASSVVYYLLASRNILRSAFPVRLVEHMWIR